MSEYLVYFPCIFLLLLTWLNWIAFSGNVCTYFHSWISAKLVLFYCEFVVFYSTWFPLDNLGRPDFLYIICWCDMVRWYLICWLEYITVSCDWAVFIYTWWYQSYWPCLFTLYIDRVFVWITVLLTPETPKTYRWLTNVTKLTNQINQRRRWDAGGWAGISCISFSFIFVALVDLYFLVHTQFPFQNIQRVLFLVLLLPGIDIIIF